MEYSKPLQIRAFDALKQMILDGTLTVGICYSETKISGELGISRTPLREAIQRLAHEGYIDVIPSKGFRIHEMTSEDLLETYQVRCALEGFCVVQIAREHDKPEAKRLIQVLESLIRDQESVIGTENEIEDFTAYDQEFHERIIDYVNNQMISDHFEHYFYKIRRQMVLSLQQAGRPKQTVKEHRAMVQAMKSGSLEESYRATLNHLEKPKGIIENMAHEPEKSGK